MSNSPGPKTPDLKYAAWLDEVIGNQTIAGVRRTRRAKIASLLAVLNGPSFETREQLLGDLAWNENVLGKVMGDATEAYIGVYKKVGASGFGTWTRIGALPDVSALDDRLSELEAALELLDGGTGATQAITEALAEFRAAEAATSAAIAADPRRPGAVHRIFTTATVGDPTLMPDWPVDLVAATQDGHVAVLSGARTIAQRGVFVVEPGRFYEARFVARRHENPSDPANHGVRLGIRWMDERYAAVGETVLADIVDLTVVSGRQPFAYGIARTPGAEVDASPPATAVFGRLFVRTWGGITHVEVIDDLDKTDGASFTIDVEQYQNEVAALAARVGAVEDQIPVVEGEVDLQLGVLEQRDLRQRLMCTLATGYNDGVTNTEIFDGAGRAPQGGPAIVTVDNVRRMFTLQRVSGATYGADERHRIVEWAYADDGSTLEPVAWSAPLNVGHQSLSATFADGWIYLWTQHPIEAGHTGLDAGKGLARVAWRGDDTTQADVTAYQLFGYAGSGHAREFIVKASPTVSRDGSLVAFVSHDLSGDVDPIDPDISDGGRLVTIFRMADILAADNPLTVEPIAGPWVHPGFRDLDDHINQAAAIDKEYVYTLSGWVNPFGWHTLFQLDHQGNLIRKTRAAFNRAPYTAAQLLAGVSGGTPISFEPEGLAIDDDGALLVLLHEGWNTSPSIVSYEGSNFAAIRASTGVPPMNGRSWARTTQAAGGAWDAGTAYTTGTLRRRAQQIYRVGPAQDILTEEPLRAGLYSRAPASALHLPISPVDLSYEDGFDFTIGAWNANTGAYRRMYQSIWESGFHRFFDMRSGGSQTSYGGFALAYSGGRAYCGVRGDRNQSNGAWIQPYGNGDSDFPYQLRMGRGGDTTGSLVINSANNVRPAYAGTQNLGASDYRWDNIYLATSPNVSSDARLKTTVRPLSEAEAAAAQLLADEIGIYQWLAAIEEKGVDEARLHVGMTVQRAIEIMEAEGLDPWRYGIIGRDEWAEQLELRVFWDAIPEVIDGEGNIIQHYEPAGGGIAEPYRPAGEVLSFRTDQLALFILKGLAARTAAIEVRLTALETAP